MKSEHFAILGSCLKIITKYEHGEGKHFLFCLARGIVLFRQQQPKLPKNKRVFKMQQLIQKNFVVHSKWPSPTIQTSLKSQMSISHKGRKSGWDELGLFFLSHSVQDYIFYALNDQVVLIFSFTRNGSQLLQTGFECSNPGVKNDNVMRNDRTFGWIKCTPTEPQHDVHPCCIYYHENILELGWL